MHTKKDKKISIIIPVYNEATIINKIMESLDEFKDYSEIIFVDGGSSDGTDKIIKEKYKVVYSPQKGRSNQMNYGASLSKGDILLFLHADSLLHRDSLNEIYRVISQGNKVGCFKISFSSGNILMKVCAVLSNLRVRVRNIAFGDQAIFIDKSYFYELGTFPAIPLMEDYQLSMNIKMDSEKIALTKTKIVTSDRRFVENGRIRTMIKMQKLQYLYRNGEEIENIANLYK